ncbi:MAG: IclR family transcriptional regulator [Rhodobacteraceae bacterium]|nr:MAG: IclR family transcriptional regulator [Paracoccaceae bacterium]
MHLERLVGILESVAIAGRGLSPAEVQKATGLPRPTCYRLLQTLANHRLIDDPGGTAHYVIAERLIRIALLGKSDIDLRHACAPALKAAATRFGDTVFLARFRSRQVEITHVETPDDPAGGFIHPGLGPRPMHACSCAKAIAAFAEDSFREEILGGTLTAYTRYTNSTRARLRAEFARIVAQGYAECHEEIDLGVSSVAAPVRIGQIGVSFSVGVVGPVRRFDAGCRREKGEELMKIAARLSAAIQLCNLVRVKDSDPALLKPAKDHRDILPSNVKGGPR